MSIDFHSTQNRNTYRGRQADSGWTDAIRRIVDPTGKRVADIGCGGGIYSLAWHEAGAGDVMGVDFSEQMVAAAREQAAGLSGISFRQGDATATGLPSAGVDIVFHRALIHHLKGYEPCFAEARRVLVPGGRLIVQDRTPADVQLPGSAEHIRGITSSAFRACWPSRLPDGQPTHRCGAPCRRQGSATSKASGCGKSARPTKAGNSWQKTWRRAPDDRSYMTSATASSPT